MNTFQAEAIARVAHNGQKYGRLDYADGHVQPVAERVLAAGGGPDAVVVAWLHDVLEDTDYRLGSSALLVLSRAQAMALAAITRGPDEPYHQYIERVVADPIARLVKFCDLQQNLSCDPPAQLRPRYVMALDRVRRALDDAGQVPTCQMMRMTAAAAAECDAHFARAKLWSKREERADMVLDWCELNGWHFVAFVNPSRLLAAMQAMPYWAQAPANYFDVARALHAACMASEPIL